MQSLAQSYAKSGDIQQAYQWMIKLDSFNGKNITLNARKGFLMNLLKTNSDLQEKEKLAKEKQNNYLIMGLLFFIISTGVVGWFWRDNYKDKKELAARNDEKALLVQEIHHRVKNNLQLLYGLAKLQLPTITDENARDLWRKNLIQLRSMSLVNEKLYKTEGVAFVNIKEFLSEIMNHYRQIFPTTLPLSIETEIEDNLIVHADFAIPFGLILTELVINSYKHAFAKTNKPNIKITFKKHKKHLVFTYTDGGQIDDTAIILNKKAGGMSLVKDLVRQLKGTMTLSNDGYLAYRFLFAV
jgi:two-component sensor histidine kinase